MVATALLAGKCGLIVGIANESSIAYACAREFHVQGARLAVTFLNEKSRHFVEPLAHNVGAELLLPCDVRQPGALEALFDTLSERWGKLDFLLHSIAFAPRDDLHGRVLDSSREGFMMAMDVSCHSFIRMGRLAEPLMQAGGCLLTVSFYGGEKVVEHYNLMGPVKAALESSARYMAVELGSRGIRVHVLSPGPLKTRAASGIDRFDELMEKTRARTPQQRLADIDDVSALAVLLASDRAKTLTGNIVYIDAGYNIVG